MMNEVIFQGECHRVILQNRGLNDKHVCILIESEDDGNWFASESPFSSYWLPKLIPLMNAAMSYLESNCIKDPDGYGWSFKE